MEQINQITYVSCLSGNSFSLMQLVLAAAVIFFIVYQLQRMAYEKTEYYAMTKNPYSSALRNSGVRGEYLTYKNLRSLPGHKRFLFNCYIPKDDGSTTEIDVILLHTSGVYVFESKNYSGWIFGTESQRMWTQTFPNGQKEKFFNPLMQNSTHIKHLKQYLHKIGDNAFRSIIVFSERCTLKEINLTTDAHKVIKRDRVLRTVLETSGREVLSEEQIEKIYSTLYPFTQATEATRMAHIDAISDRHSNTKEKSSPPVSAEPQQATAEIQDYTVIVDSKPIKYCGKCGSEMVIRTASRGERKGKQFWGCSNYPKCRHTVDIE